MLDTVPVEYTSLYSQNFDVLCEAAGGWDQQYSQLSKGSFKGQLDLAQIGTRQFLREKWSNGLCYHGSGPENGYGFGLRYDKTGLGLINGQAIHANDLISLAPGKEAEVIGVDGFDLLVLSFDEDELNDLTRSMAGHRVLDDGIHQSISLPASVADWMRRAGDEVMSTVAADPFKTDEIATLTDQFVKQFVWSLVQLRQVDPQTFRPAKPRQIVTQAIDLALGPEGRDLGLVEISKHLNISLRSLQYAFEAEKGMSAATWLRIRRLNRVRNELIRGGDEDIQIKRVAAKNGFSHLGHFAAQYKRLFGYLPSETPRLRSGSV